jgi:hypothetical protein
MGWVGVGLLCSFTTQDVDFDVTSSVMNTCENYCHYNQDKSSLAAYTVLYMELRSKAVKSDDRSGVSKAATWKNII